MSTINNTKHTDSLDQLLQNTYSNYSVPEPNVGSWLKVKNKVAKHNFLKFNPMHFNVYYAVIATIVTIGVGVHLYLSNENEEKSIHNIQTEQVLTEPTIENTPLDNKNPSEVETEQLLPVADQNKIPSDANENANEEIIIAEEHVENTTHIATEDQRMLNKETSESEEEQIKEDRIDNEKPLIINEALEETTSNNEVTEKSGFNNTITIDSTEVLNDEDKKTKQPVIINREPVVQTDTIVKVIKKKRKRRK
ncbi:hypothetical protein [Plebeiibacterium marinum]|uniref:Uncharacterized protein n=1 Tax=Plebeiibacterium marinum TaxID=2992111 RepID=A0AAE3MH86_9BACT|nr:hypothetical protein [Plebeiobacterium marinum]MCW3807671.1 hypothetical protein [Plebeiobacterium marinum]